MMLFQAVQADLQMQPLPGESGQGERYSRQEQAIGQNDGMALRLAQDLVAGPGKIGVEERFTAGKVKEGAAQSGGPSRKPCAKGPGGVPGAGPGNRRTGNGGS